MAHRYAIAHLTLLVTASAAAWLVTHGLWTPVAHAQSCQTHPGSLSELDADDLMLRGVACFEEESFGWALMYYQRAYERDDDPFLYGAMGRSLQELGLYSSAQASFQRFLESNPPPTPSSAERIDNRVEELNAMADDELAVITLGRPHDQARAFLVLDNGERYKLGALPTTLTVDPDQDLTLEVRAPGYRPRQFEIHPQSGDPTRLDPTLVADDATLSLDDRSRRRLGLGMGTTGLTMATAGVAFFAMGSHHGSRASDLDADDFDELSDLDRRQRHHLDRQDRYRRLGIVGASAGGALLLGATLLYLRTSSSPSSIDEASAQRLQPLASPRQVGVQFRF